MKVVCEMESISTGEQCTISISGSKDLIDGIFKVLEVAELVVIED